MLFQLIIYAGPNTNAKKVAEYGGNTYGFGSRSVLGSGWPKDLVKVCDTEIPAKATSSPLSPFGYSLLWQTNLNCSRFISGFIHRSIGIWLVYMARIWMVEIFCLQFFIAALLIAEFMDDVCVENCGVFAE